jgi:hypothetical protein
MPWSAADDRCRVIRHGRVHVARRRVFGRIDEDAIDQWRFAVGAIGHGDAVQCRAAGDVTRVARYVIDDGGVGRVLGADVLHRDRVAQRLAGKQYVRVTVDVGRDLFDEEVGCRNDQQLGRVLVAVDVRVGGAIDVRVVTDRDREAGEVRRRLVQYDRVVRDDG